MNPRRIVAYALSLILVGSIIVQASMASHGFVLPAASALPSGLSVSITSPEDDTVVGSSSFTISGDSSDDNGVNMVEVTTDAFYADNNAYFIQRRGNTILPGGSFDSPFSVAIDSSGNVYVADYNNNRIQKFNPEGTFLTTWGSPGDGQSEFNSPIGIAVDKDRNVYVVDSGNHRVQKFNSEGFITQWGSYGSGEGEFNRPYGIAIDSGDNIYVADTSNHRVQKFTSDGTFLTTWGSYGSGNSQFDYSVGIAVDSSGNVYVADYNNHRVQKFTSDGTFLTTWGSYGSGNGQFDYPAGIAVDSGDNIYVTDSGNNRVQKFDSSGTFIFSIPEILFRGPAGIAVDSDGSVYVIDNGYNRIQKLTSTGRLIHTFGNSGSGNGQFHSPVGIAVDSSSNVYVVDSGNNRIQKFTSDGTFLTTWGSPGSGEGEFDSPVGIAVDSSGNVYVADAYNNRVQKFDSDGHYITQWGSPGSGEGEFDYPEFLTLDRAGNVYVVDSHNNRIQKFTGDGDFITKWGTHGSGDGEFDLPLGIAVDSSGNVYVADYLNNSVQKFGPHYTAAHLDSPGETSTTWSVDTLPSFPLSGGHHTITARALDIDENSVASTIEIMVDAIPPSISITSPTDGQVLGSGTFTISGTASDNFHVNLVEVSIDSGPFAAATGTTSWTFDVTSVLSQGEHTIVARATDAAGNTETSSTININVVIPSTGGGGGGGGGSIGGGGGGGGSVIINQTFPPEYFNANPLSKFIERNSFFKDLTGNSIVGGKVGQQINIGAIFHNYQQVSQDYAMIVQIVDENGFTIDLGWITGTVDAGKDADGSRSWTPEEGGNYTIKIFVWNNVSNTPMPLSEVTSKTFSVTS